MASYQTSLQSSALLWSMASLGNKNGSGGSGEPGKPGTQWYFLSGPITENEPAQSYMNVGDIVLDETDTELFRVVQQGSQKVLSSTGVTLRPESEAQKSLYQLYLDLEPKKPLTQAQFHDRFLEALEDHPQFNLYEFYKTSGGLKYTTEKDFNEQFIKLMDFDPDSIVTDRIVSKDGKNHVISDNNGIDAVGEKVQIVSNTTITVEAVNALLDAKEVVIQNSSDTEAQTTHLKNVVDPVHALDAVNKQTLDKAVADLDDKINTVKSTLETSIQEVNDKVIALDEREQEHYINVLDLINKLNDKHTQDMNNILSTINSKFIELKTEISDYLTEQLPIMIEEEVKKQLEGLNPGGCDGSCLENIDSIDGNVWPNINTEVLVFDNGKANSTDKDFEYVMTSNDPSDTWEQIYRECWGGDADPKDDPQFMNFIEWLEDRDMVKIFWGMDADERDDVIKDYQLWDGGSATSKW